ncbi:hypothetical protein AOLI_G00313750 [Acnodon oligacanthus]
MRRELEELGLNSCAASRKPLISEANQQRWLQFAREHKDWTLEQWKKVMESDESRFTLFQRERRIRRGSPQSVRSDSSRSAGPTLPVLPSNLDDPKKPESGEIREHSFLFNTLLQSSKDTHSLEFKHVEKLGVPKRTAGDASYNTCQKHVSDMFLLHFFLSDQPSQDTLACFLTPKPPVEHESGLTQQPPRQPQLPDCSL